MKLDECCRNLTTMADSTQHQKPHWCQLTFMSIAGYRATTRVAATADFSLKDPAVSQTPRLDRLFARVGRETKRAAQTDPLRILPCYLLSPN